MVPYLTAVLDALFECPEERRVAMQTTVLVLGIVRRCNDVSKEKFEQLSLSLLTVHAQVL